MTGYQGHSALAISLDSKGDVTGSDKVVWSLNRGTPYVPSPLLYDGLLFFNQSSQARWSCVDAKTGDIYVDRKPLQGMYGVYASPVAADGRVYVTDRNGTTLVLKHNKEFHILATNHLEDTFNSSPALAGDQMFLRGHRFLYCLSEK
ncbi:PQQ-like beta-propeller repeat protein [Verrucomicrobia bacterium]|nr:PQQ-like beta-propeller repeat protein [Verrucomicrobiota bacterium]